MRRIVLLPVRQRVVIVIAIGAVLLILGDWITDRRGTGGWFGYAPLTQVGVVPSSLSPGLATAVHLAVVVVWAAASLWLLGGGQRPQSIDAPSPPASTDG